MAKKRREHMFVPFFCDVVVNLPYCWCHYNQNNCCNTHFSLVMLTVGEDTN